MIDLRTERLKQLPLNSDAVWEGGWRPLPDVIVVDDHEPQRYCMGLWGCLQRQVIGPGRDMVQPAAAATSDKLLDLMVDFAVDQRLTGYRPGRVCVDDEQTALFLADKLKDAGIEVAWTARLDFVAAAAEDLSDHLSGTQVGSLSLFSAPELSLARIIEFGDAAAEFHRAAPWTSFSDLDLFRIVSPFEAPGLEYAVILGNAGQEFGLGFYADADQHDAVIAGSPETFLESKTPVWFLTFCGRQDRGFREMMREWADKGMPLAAEDAYPMLLCRLPDGEPRLPGPEELVHVTGLLRALARTTTDMADEGRWSLTVPTGPGDATYRLELPYVLEPLSPQTILRWGIEPDPRANEGVMSAIASMLHDQPEGGTDTDDLNARFAGRSFEDIMNEADLPDTPRQRARNICYEAYDAVGYRRQILARRALREDPDCIGALTLLAEETSDPDRRWELSRDAAEAARRLLDASGPADADCDPHFDHELRPAVRALASATVVGVNAGRTDEALAYGLEALRWSPAGGFSVRHVVLNGLLLADRLDEAESLLDRWPGLDPPADEPPLPRDEADFMAGRGDRLFVAAARVLLEARARGALVTLERRLRDLQRSNRYVLPMLYDGKRPPRTALGNSAPSGAAVAEFTGGILGDAWRATPALGELRRVSGRRGPGKTGQKRRKKRGRG